MDKLESLPGWYGGICLLVGGAAGAAAAEILAHAMGWKSPFGAPLAGAVLGGALAILLERPAMIFATAILGGTLVSLGGWSLAVSPGGSGGRGIPWPFLVLLVLTAIGGGLVQAAATRNLPAGDRGAESGIKE